MSRRQGFVRHAITWQGSTSAGEADRDHFQGHAQESETVAPCGLFRPNHALQVSETFGGKSFDFFAISMFPWPRSRKFVCWRSLLASCEERVCRTDKGQKPVDH